MAQDFSQTFWVFKFCKKIFKVAARHLKVDDFNKNSMNQNIKVFENKQKKKYGNLVLCIHCMHSFHMGLSETILWTMFSHSVVYAVDPCIINLKYIFILQKNIYSEILICEWVYLSYYSVMLAIIFLFQQFQWARALTLYQRHCIKQL